MRAIVFTGPTLPPEQAREFLDAEYRPPAARGDVYRATLGAVDAIGIVDGYFERRPSVWHKEILWAMSRGIHVFGAGSIGALRAAELSSFGMRGIGLVFEAFRDGLLEDDDEVAVEHAPREAGYVSTDAMVNIRATIEAATAAGILRSGTAARLTATAKSLFFKERTYAGLLSTARAHGLPSAELEVFRAWLSTGKVDRKRDDAKVLLTKMREFLATNPAPQIVAFSFKHTTKWEALVQRESPASPTV